MKTMKGGPLLCSVTMLSAAISTAYAQQAPAPEKPDQMQSVTVVGSSIKGSRITTALPVTVVTADEIAATGAVDGDDLLRTVPQLGDVFFNPTNQAQTSNTARGDVSSVDLRGAGLGDTLVMLNGRRLVTHPTSNGNNTVPLITYNSSAIPAAGLQSVEVLMEGAGAIYGSDAVAGVVNTITKTNFNGLTGSVQYGTAENTNRHEVNTNLFGGRNFKDGRGNVSLSLSILNRTRQNPSDMPFTANQDKRPLFAGTPWANSGAPDGRGGQSSWINGSVFNGTRQVTSAIKQNGTNITTAAGAFHIQPNTYAGCLVQLGNNLCLGSGGNNQNGNAPGNILRYNNAANDYITVAPSIHRQNALLTGHFDLTDNDTVYGELGLYHAVAHTLTTQPTSLVAVGVPASNYYNPFGPVTFADGTPNPNRIPGLTNVPASGLPLTFTNYRFNDYGPDHIDVTNYQYRYLVGLKGARNGWDYDTGLLYTYATAEDLSDGVDSNALYKQLALSTPDAYNPFNGSCIDGSGGGDCNPSSKAAIDATKIRIARRSRTGLLLADFKLSRPDLFNTWAGPVGVAVGTELRRETQRDDRDPHVNGSMPFYDAVTGLTQPSSATGVNVTPSSSGSRRVAGAFLELAVPLVSEGMNIPLVQSLNMQVAGRYEHYSDFGSVSKPKLALAWDVNNYIRFRGSYSEGFKAPNLETTADYSYGRASSVTDYYKCEADVRAGRLTNWNNCGRGVGVRYFISGNPQLGPETSNTSNIGIVLRPDFLPEALGRFTVTLDRWRINQTGIVGVLGLSNVTANDYLDRVNGGAGDPRIVRAEPNADDIAAFAGTNLKPVGNILDVKDTFLNLQPQKISGYDFNLIWRKKTAGWGSFDGNINVAYMDRYTQLPLSGIANLLEARTAGILNPALPLADLENNRLRNYGKPANKVAFNMTWKLRDWQVGVSANYIGSVLEPGLLADDGTPWEVDNQTLVNGYVQYRFSNAWLKDARIKLGGRNLFDKLPPLAQGGYNGGLYNPYGRYLYLNLSNSF
ncbi:TonB-dependent receptor [Massilia arenosa]|uniref:TonB-dependent receptor n=1 Tax=Zemynaea arenosa TaxID=2561931 RepID=A0A4Y9SHA9_9BURK|nr:TonB-dependent receptor [Massilia arenosa]TFW20813.1 TonB-dependent receptor [Massilia arenosa]